MVAGRTKTFANLLYLERTPCKNFWIRPCASPVQSTIYLHCQKQQDKNWLRLSK